MKQYARIRYKKTVHEGIVESINMFVSNTEHESKYKIELNYNDMTYKIINLVKGYAVKSSIKDKVRIPSHRFTLLKQARKALESLNVVLLQESKKDRDLDSLLSQAEQVTQNTVQ